MTSTRKLPKGTSVRFEFHDDDSAHLTRSKHRREFMHILDIVDKQTGTPDGPNDQPAMARATSVKQTAKRNGVSDPESRLRACIEQGKLVSWTADEGDERVQRLCLARPDDLKAAIGEENGREHPNLDKIERLAATIAEVQGDD